MTADRDEYMRRQEADHALLDMRTRPTTARPALGQPFDIDHAAERAKAEKDSQLLGTGFLVDGLHVSPPRVTMIRKAYWPHVTTTELYNDLAQVLRDKGASDEWVAFVMGDLQLAATQYAHTRWVQGHAAGAAGQSVPNPQCPPDSAAERPAETGIDSQCYVRYADSLTSGEHA